MSHDVRDKDDTFAYVQTYFSEDENYLFKQWLPRFYYFCVRTLLRLPAYASLYVFPFLVFPSQKIFLIIWLSYGAIFVLKAFIIRSVCSNLLVVTQKAVYLYFRYNEERTDEFRWEDVQTVTFRTWRFAPSLATVNLQKNGQPLQIREKIDRQRTYRTRYNRPETLDYRELTLNKPHSLRLVVRNHGELYERCRQLQQTEGYTFLLKRKGKPHAYAKCKTNRTGVGK